MVLQVYEQRSEISGAENLLECRFVIVKGMATRGDGSPVFMNVLH